MRTSRPIEDVLPYNFLGLMMKDACATNASHVLVAFDGSHLFRHEIFPEYKANRTGKSSTVHLDNDGGGAEIYSYLPHVRSFLESAGIVWMQNKRYEADDALASAAVQYGGLPDTKVIMASKDKDGYQSLRSNVVAYDSTSEPPVYITVDVAEKKKGIKVEHMVMYQTLIGDKIDNIPALKSPQAAKKVINTWGSFKAWFDNSKEERAWLRANQAKLQLNRMLVEMQTDLMLPELSELVVPKLDRQNMPRAWYAYQSFRYPKTKGLFKR